MSLDAMVRAMAYQSMLLHGLPSHRFFTPAEGMGFWKHLDLIVPNNVQLVDCGCGMGDLIGEAEVVGRKLIGIDVGRREGQDERVQWADAITYDWSPTVWPLICRPSHDGWAWDTMQNARNKGATVLYVGLPKNYKYDLGTIRGCDLGVVGEEGEHLIVIRPYRRAMKKRAK